MPTASIKRALIAFPFVLVVGVGVVWFWWEMSERSSAYSTAAGRYYEYAEAYRQHGEHDPILFSTCYGERWDRYSDRVMQDRGNAPNDPVYLARREAYYRGLSKKYHRAARQPWSRIRLDPPLDSP